jgi:hypothetical protein
MKMEERSSTPTQRMMCSLAYHIANALELVFCCLSCMDVWLDSKLIFGM